MHEHRKSEHKEEYYVSLVESIITLGQSEDFIGALAKVIQKLVVMMKDNLEKIKEQTLNVL